MRKTASYVFVICKYVGPTLLALHNQQLELFMGLSSFETDSERYFLQTHRDILKTRYKRSFQQYKKLESAKKYTELHIVTDTAHIYLCKFFEGLG